MALSSNRVLCIVATLLLSLVAAPAVAPAGGLLGRQRSVGGVVIDAQGLVSSASIEQKQELRNLMRVVLDAPRGELAEQTELRMISLKGLQQAIRDSQQTGEPLPDEIALLAGLQRVEYVFVDEENSDIILAGPAEPWQLREDGSVVGAVTGGATLRLDDLMVALQTVETARREGISCSIEPTAEGRRRLQQLLRRVTLRPGQNPAYLEPAMREAFGPQQIRLSGIPRDSRYARTLVAADYEMKRIAMALADSSVKNLPSYLQMARNAQHGSAQNPRWWMACNYDALSRTEDGLAWRLSGQGVKTLTEQDVVAEDGSVAGSGREDKLAARWAELMTEHFNELARNKSVFSDLRNAMDLTVVATLIAQEGLDQRAGLDLALLRNESGSLDQASFTAPQAVEPQCSFVRGRSGWVVTASGGVDINAFQVVQKQVTEPKVGQTRQAALAADSDNRRWWWNR